MEMRDYQTEAYNCTLKKFEQTDTVLCVMATGLGKTFYAVNVAGHFQKTGRIMWLAHREELIFQAADSMHNVLGVDPDIEMGELYSGGSYFFKSKMIVSTIQTQNAGREKKRMERFDPNEFSLLVVDEGHHAPSPSYRRVIDYYKQNPDLKVLGLTATPDRHDKKAMGQIFDEVAYKYDIRDGIDDGWLVPIEQMSVFVDSLDYSDINSQAGELNGTELAKVLEFEENLHGIADPTVKLVGDKKTLVFAASVVQAERLTEIFNRHKPDSARYVTGKTPKEIRRGMFDDYSNKRFQFLVNVGVATEGFDDPGIECVVLARPTKSRSLFTQMVGRGTRPLGGLVDKYDDAVGRREAIHKSDKPNLEVIDFVGNAGRHKLITTADILGGKYTIEEIDLASTNAANKSAKDGKPVDMATELEQAERDIAKRRAEGREASWREQVKLRAKYSTAKVNPFDVMDVNPVREMPWHKDRQPSKKQREFLKKNGVDIDGMDYTNVKNIIDTIFRRMEEGKPSYRQTKQLFIRGIDCTKINRKQAGMMMGELVANRWKTPVRWFTLECYTKRRKA